MSEPLETYLNDHYAGSKVAVDLLEALRDQHRGEPLGSFAEELLDEVEADRIVLRDLIRRIDEDGPQAVKVSLAWVGEKMARIKLHRRSDHGLGTLEALETVALGILGKLSLWKALAAAAATDSRLDGVDYEELVTRARHQHDRVEQRRLGMVPTVLGTFEE